MRLLGIIALHVAIRNRMPCAVQLVGILADARRIAEPVLRNDLTILVKYERRGVRHVRRLVGQAAQKRDRAERVHVALACRRDTAFVVQGMAQAVSNLLLVDTRSRAAFLALGGERVAAEVIHQLAGKDIEANALQDLVLVHPAFVGVGDETLGNRLSLRLVLIVQVVNVADGQGVITGAVAVVQLVHHLVHVDGGGLHAELVAQDVVVDEKVGGQIGVALVADHLQNARAGKRLHGLHRMEVPGDFLPIDRAVHIFISVADKIAHHRRSDGAGIRQDEKRLVVTAVQLAAQAGHRVAVGEDDVDIGHPFGQLVEDARLVMELV